MTNHQNELPSDRVSALDGFRGLAVLMVTTYRFGEVSLTESVVGKWVSKAVYLGASGVDLFFVLSGFLITGILLNQKGSSRYFSTFYARRAFRIFPLYYTSLIVFLWILPSLGINSILIEGKIADTTKEITANTVHLWFYTSNLSTAWANKWQFGALDHFWSLAIEEQFYLLWPLVVFLFPRQQLLKVCLVSCSVLVTCRILFDFATGLDVTSKTFTLFRVDGLLLGACAAIAFPKKESQNNKWMRRTRLGYIALGTLFAATLILGQNDLTIRYTIVSLAGTLILVGTLSSNTNSPERMVFENRFLRSLGKYSYAMYIFQLPLIPLMAPWIAPTVCEEWCSNPLLGAILYVFLMFALTYAISILSWYFLESRFLALREKLFRQDIKRIGDV